MGDGFSVDLPALHELRQRLGNLAGHLRTVSATLAGVTADTGRSDSDEMGRLGATDAAEVVDLLQTHVLGDVERVAASANGYDGTDGRGAARLGGAR